MFKQTNKIIYLLFLCIVLTVVIVSSTYAWFTNNQSLETTNINVKARASQKIELSTDAKNWKSAITLRDILDAEYDTGRLNQVPNNFLAYSTVGNISDGLLDMFYGLVTMDKNPGSDNYGKRVLTSEKVVETDGINGGFLTFDLYLKNDLANSIYLGKKSYVKYVLEDSGIKNALRVAFVYEGSMPSGTEPSILQSLKTSLKSNVVIWEANSDAHTAEAIKSASDVYGIDLTSNPVKLPYYAVKKEFTNPQLLTSTSDEYFELMDNTLYTPSDYETSDTVNKLIFNLPAGISKIRVYAWVEGQDVDCENNAAGSDFEFNFNFTTKVKES